MKPHYLPKKRKSLSQKMALTFFYFVILPCTILSFLSAFFFQKGIHSWFKQRIQIAMKSADALSHTYIQNSFSHINKISNAIVAKYNALEQKESILIHSHISDFLDVCESIGDTSSAVFKRNKKSINPLENITPLIASKNWNKSIIPQIPSTNLDEAQQKTSSVLLSVQENHLSILRHIHGNIFLIVQKSLEPLIIQSVFNAKSSINSYVDDLKEEKRWFWSSIFIFLTSCAILMALSFWGSLSFKRSIIAPVNALSWGVQMLAQGKDGLVDVKQIKTSKELFFLVESFNKMALDIKEKNKGLKKINKDLNEKNLFMETVFQSVSSGIIILSEKGVVILSNKQAESLLRHEKIVGKSILSFHDEFKEIISKATRNPEKIHTQEIFFKDSATTLHAHMRYNHLTQNIILTLDDVGHLIASQKKEALLDIARRVAHEIRNPLTPIVLSAERLARRYATDIQNKEVFQNCLDSIIRHAEIIGKIVKEFSHFVRMPSIQLKNTDLSFLLKNNIDFHRSAYPDIDFEYKGLPCFVSCDPTHIERAVNNLVKNALEATQEIQGKKVINITLKENKQSVEIIIKDNGVGLNAEHILSKSTVLFKKITRHGIGIVHCGKNSTGP